MAEDQKNATGITHPNSLKFLDELRAVRAGLRDQDLHEAGWDGKVDTPLISSPFAKPRDNNRSR